EDVALDAADARGRALVRLDGRGVAVALDLERDGEPVTHVHQPRVLLARADEERAALARERLEHGDGVLVRAVLAPHHGVDAELGEGGRAAELLDGPAVLLLGEAVLAGEVEGDVGLVGEVLGRHGGGIKRRGATGPAAPTVRVRKATEGAKAPVWYPGYGPTSTTSLRRPARSASFAAGISGSRCSSRLLRAGRTTISRSISGVFC